MALRGALRERDIPEGAVILDEGNAMAHQGYIMKKWQPQSEVFFLRYGLTILGSAVGISSFFINNYLRRKLKLYSHAAGTSLLLTGGSSIIVLCGTHFAYIRRQILLSDSTICPACIDAKAILLQNVSGILHPIVAGSAVNFGFAYKTASVNMPRMMDVKKMSQYWWSVIKPMGKNAMIMSLCQTILASFVINRELMEFQRIQESLSIQESILEERGTKKQLFHL